MQASFDCGYRAAFTISKQLAEFHAWISIVLDLFESGHFDSGEEDLQAFRQLVRETLECTKKLEQFVSDDGGSSMEEDSWITKARAISKLDLLTARAKAQLRAMECPVQL